MQGQVFVPYTGIGGFNMDTGVSLYSVGGSTAPGVVEDEYGTTVNVTWTFPGGINALSSGGVGQWGYALVPATIDSTYITDVAIKQWLTGTYFRQGEVEVQPSVKYYSEEDINAETPGVMTSVQDDINLLVKAYVSRLLKPGNGGSYDDFKKYFSNCYTIGSPG